jgi:hypothetical protein
MQFTGPETKFCLFSVPRSPKRPALFFLSPPQTPPRKEEDPVFRRRRRRRENAKTKQRRNAYDTTSKFHEKNDRQKKKNDALRHTATTMRRSTPPRAPQTKDTAGCGISKNKVTDPVRPYLIYPRDGGVASGIFIFMLARPFVAPYSNPFPELQNYCIYLSRTHRKHKHLQFALAYSRCPYSSHRRCFNSR